jgi:hypothetical protein
VSPLPISRSALDRLGERLAASDDITDADYALLLEVLSAYQEALLETRERLVALGYSPTTRTKTTSVLVDKLRRERGMKLKGVQDIAGARIVEDCTRSEQDAIVARIVEEFGDGTRPPKVKDRRAEPVAGYRAVHVIVHVRDLPVEVQVRTWRQDQWAQIAESLGDTWGRGLRYGAGPSDPGKPAYGEMTRDDIWAAVVNLSDLVHHNETIEGLIEVTAGLEPDRSEAELAEERADQARHEELLREHLALFSRVVRNVR